MLQVSQNLFCWTGTLKPSITSTHDKSRNNGNIHPPYSGRVWNQCVSMCVSFQCNHYICGLLYSQSSLESWRLKNAPRKRSHLLISRVRSCPGSQPQSVSWDSTFWVIFSSCFADCSWLRYSSTLKLAVVNFSCNAFTSGLSAFEEKKGFGKNRICSEEVKLWWSQIQQNLFLPDPWKYIPYF